jgi:release factor glutamine methyltransferase
LGVSKSWLYAHPTRPLTEAEIDRFEVLVRRRMRHEPVAYLVGFKPFYGLDITVDPRVLIPRPETELLVERVLDYLRDGFPPSMVSSTAQGNGATMKATFDEPGAAGQSPRVADVGTGSGAIAVALAVNAPGVMVYATDLSEDALAVAAQNVWRYGVGEQVQLLPGPLVEAIPGPVDVIVANLPYVASPALLQLAPEVREYEPILALDGGPDGLDIITAFMEAMAKPAGRGKLRAGGRVYLEIGADQGDSVRALAQAAFPDGWVDVQVDYSGMDRLLMVDTGRVEKETGRQGNK